MGAANDILNIWESGAGLHTMELITWAYTCEAINGRGVDS